MGKPLSEPQNRKKLRNQISKLDRQANTLMAVSDIANITQDIQADMLLRGEPLGGEVVVCLDGEQQDDFEDRVAAALRRMR